MRITFIALSTLALAGCVHATIDQRRVFEGARPCGTPTVVVATEAPLAIEAGTIPVANDVALSTITLRPAKARGTLIYFGGNAIRHCEPAVRDTSYAKLLRHLAQLEVNIVLVNYRGYGGSGGTPTFDVVKQDALAVYDHIVAADFAAPIMVHGQSLGTLFAATLATYRPLSRVVLESPPTTYRDVISSALPWYAKPFVRIDLTPEVEAESTLPMVARVYQPTLIVVGAQDPITPPSMARRVHAALASKQKDLRIIPKGRHGDLVHFAEYWTVLGDFLRPATHGAPAGVQHH